MASFARLTLALLLLLLLGAWSGCCYGTSAQSAAKMKRSSPVVAVEIDGVTRNLIITTDIDGVLLCSDLSDKAAMSANLEFDYARRLLRLQLQSLSQELHTSDVSIPALGYSGSMLIGVFKLKKQWLSPATVEYFLKSSRATGFLGVGFAFRPVSSPLWKMLGESSQYSYQGMTNTTTKTARISVENTNKDSEDNADAEGETTSTAVDEQSFLWSEPLASVDQQDEFGNNQGLSFAIHEMFIRCASSSSNRVSPWNQPESSTRIAIFGEFSSNWDVSVDFNTPCLVLPQEFYESLVGWLGLSYNDELKLSEMPASMLLPALSFSLSYRGTELNIPLQKLVLAELQNNATGTARVCIQRSGSIIQNGASIFYPLDQDAGSVQRYRVHTSASLPLFNMFQAPIVFGSMVLDTLEQIVFDGKSKETGVRADLDSDEDELPTNFSAKCRPALICIGQQDFVPRTNGCQDPDCSLYYFHRLDEATKRCVVESGWVVTLFSTIGLLLLAESAFNMTIRRLVTQAAARAS